MLIPISVIEKFEVSNKCRDQAEIVSLEIGRMIKTGLAIIADPYVPHAPISSKKIRNVWGNKLTDLNGESSAFVTKRQFYGRYLGTIPSKYVLLDHSMEEWREINHFYKIIKNNETFVDLENRIWNLQLRTECGWEIWKRSKRFYEKCDQ